MRLTSLRGKWRAAAEAAVSMAVDEQRRREAQARQSLLGELQQAIAAIRQEQRLQLLVCDDEDAYFRLLLSSEGTEKDRELVEVLTKVDRDLKKFANEGCDIENPPSSMNNNRASSFSSSSAEAAAMRRSALNQLLPFERSVPVFAKLMPFQQDAVRWLVDTCFVKGLSCILADDMGLGKTVQAIAMLSALQALRRAACPATSRPRAQKSRSRGKVGASLNDDEAGVHITLVLSPLSTIPHWVAEFERFGLLSSFRVFPLNGLREEREAMAGAALDYIDHLSDDEESSNDEGAGMRRDVVIVAPHDMFAKPLTGKFSKLRSVTYSCLIVDEAQRLKNTECGLYRVLTTSLRLAPGATKLILTGTPLQNNILELFALLEFLLPASFSKKRHAEIALLMDRLLKKKTGGSVSQDYELQMLLCKRVHRLFGPLMLRREKVDVLDQLPRKDEHTITCPIVPFQRWLLELATTGTMRLPAFGYGKSAAARKILLHPYMVRHDFYIDDNIVRCCGRMILLDFMLNFFIRTKHKTLIFVWNTTVIDIIVTYLEFKQIGYVVLDGRVSTADRQTRISSFFDDPTFAVPVFILSKGAGGVGLNLQAADTVILFDTDYNPMKDVQALSRAFRVGQDKHVKVFRLHCDHPVEKRTAAIVSQKVLLSDKVVLAGKYDRESTDEQREAIVRRLLAVNGDGSTEELTHCVEESGKMERDDDDDGSAEEARDDQEAPRRAADIITAAAAAAEPPSPPVDVFAAIDDALLKVPEAEYRAFCEAAAGLLPRTVDETALMEAGFARQFLPTLAVQGRVAAPRPPRSVHHHDLFGSDDTTCTGSRKRPRE
jgi:ATP-dependent helicase STH1/SNF2